MAVLIGFTGLKGAGKDTAADALVRKFGFLKIGFAEPIKFMLAEIMVRRGCPQSEIADFLDGPRKEERTPYLMGRTPRHALQTLGTEWGRECISPSMWVDTFARRAFACLSAGDSVVVADVRFPNEAAIIRELGGKVYRVNRPGLVADAHASENQAADMRVDGELDNIHTSASGFAYFAKDYFADMLVAA